MKEWVNGLFTVAADAGGSAGLYLYNDKIVHNYYV